MKFTTLPRTERGSLLLLGAVLLGGSSIAAPNSGSGDALPLETESLMALPTTSAPALGEFHEALVGGRFWGGIRYRFESVDQDKVGAPFDSEARASTLRTRLGYETGKFRGLSGVLEFSNVSSIPGGYNDYNDKVDSNPPNRPVIADPEGTVVNQVYLKYGDVAGGDIKLGRQRIALGNKRFIGNVGWRQTEQTYDAISYDGEYGYGMSMYYAYIDRDHDIFGRSNEHGSHILNLKKAWENLGTLLLYGYYLDFSDKQILSTMTVGGSFTGDRKLTDNSSVNYGIEIAHQTDVRDNPNKVGATYSHAYLGGKMMGASLKVGFESLDGDHMGDANQAFQTPLATKHAWNGWADKFLKTPAGGLEDVYISLGYKKGDLAADVTYHNFNSEISTVNDYGSEVDARITYKVNKNMSVGFKLADFNADNGNTVGLEDTEKAWFWLGYNF